MPVTFDQSVPSDATVHFSPFCSQTGAVVSVDHVLTHTPVLVVIGWREQGYPSALDSMLQRFEGNRSAVIRIGQGWWPLVLRVHNDLLALDPEYVLRQVTEEHAELRFDAFPRASLLPGNVFGDVIRDAESNSGRICEVCGRQGRTMRQENWLVTLCWDDAAEYGAHRIAPNENLDGIVPRATTREFTFAVSAGVPPEVYTVAGQAGQRTRLEKSQREANMTVASWPGTDEVGRLLNISRAEVERLRTLGRIGAEKDSDGRWRFAPWQIGQDGCLIPHLSQVLRAAPRDYTLIDLSYVLTEPDENLCDQSPVDWLKSGHSLSEVLGLLNELAMT